MVPKKDEKLYYFIKELVRTIASKNSEGIVDVLFKKKKVNEFKIAEKLGITINQARNILYRLSDFSIMDSIRKKDKRKGWYTYFWTINEVKALETLIKFKTRQMDLLEKILRSRKLKNFYSCSADNIEMSEETAMHHSFLCPECGQLLQPLPKEKKIKEFTTKINQTNKSISLIKEELERIRPKPKLKPTKRKKYKKKYKKKKKIKKKKIKKHKKKVEKPEKKGKKKKFKKKIKKKIKKRKIKEKPKKKKKVKKKK